MKRYFFIVFLTLLLLPNSAFAATEYFWVSTTHIGSSDDRNYKYVDTGCSLRFEGFLNKIVIVKKTSTCNEQYYVFIRDRMVYETSVRYMFVPYGNELKGNIVYADPKFKTIKTLGSVDIKPLSNNGNTDKTCEELFPDTTSTDYLICKGYESGGVMDPGNNTPDNGDATVEPDDGASNPGPVTDSTEVPITTLITSPSKPDVGNVFKETPMIALRSNISGSTYYKWNNGNWVTYSGPFIAKRGSNTLYYYSKNVSGIEEDKKEQVINVGGYVTSIFSGCGEVEGKILNCWLGKVFSWSQIVIGSLTVLMIMIGGVIYMTSAGDPDRMGMAKKLIFGALIGVTVIILGRFFLVTVLGVSFNN